jgi:chitinase
VDAVYPVTGASHVLSMFYCGFSGNFCGQSTLNDVNSKSAIIILAFANTQSDGSIIIDTSNYPTSLVNSWRAKTKKVIISVGGQNGDWNVVFSSDASVNNFVNSVANYIAKYNLDGVDLDI